MSEIKSVMIDGVEYVPKVQEKPTPEPERDWSVNRALKPLESGQEYCYLGCDGVIYKELWNNHNFDESLLSIGNVYLDKQSAENVRDAQRLAQKCRVAMAESWGDIEVDWEDLDQNKQCVEVLDGEVIIECRCARFQKFHFRLEEHAQAFIDKHGEAAVCLMIREG